MKSYLVAAFVLMAGPQATSAALLDFTSTGSLGCGAAANCTASAGSITFADGAARLTISYTGNTESDLNVPDSPSFATTSYGLIAVNCTVCAGLTANFNLGGATLGLGVNQGPDPGNASQVLFDGLFTGTLSVSSGGGFGGFASVAFSPVTASVTTGATTIEYFLSSSLLPGGATGTPISIGNIASFQGAVSVATAVPESSTFALTGIGLLGLAAFRRRAQRLPGRGA